MVRVNTLTTRIASGVFNHQAEVGPLPAWFETFSQIIDQKAHENKITESIAALAKTFLARYMHTSSNRSLNNLIVDLSEDTIASATGRERKLGINLYVPLNFDQGKRLDIFSVFDKVVEEHYKSATKTDDDARFFLQVLDRNLLFHLLRNTVHNALSEV